MVSPLLAPARRNAWIWFSAIGLAAVVAYFTLPVSAKNFGFDVFGLGAVVVIVVGVRVYRPQNPVAWYAMALGQLLFVVGDLIWTYYEEILNKESPLPSIADVAYLGGYIPLMVGLLMVVRARRPGHDLGSLLDAAIVTVTAAVPAYVFLIAPQALDTELTVAGRAVSISYVLVDLMLIAVAASLLFSTRAASGSLRLIAASLVCLIAADVAYTFTSLDETYFTGHPLDAGWLISYVLWGAAALHPSMRDLTEPARAEEQGGLTRRRAVALGLGAVVIPMVQLYRALSGATLHRPILAIASTIAFLLVVARMAGLAARLENTALHDPLTGLPNRRLLLDRLRQAMARMERASHPVNVLFLDLGRFKAVNDVQGHDAGDDVLIEVGRRIKSAVRRSDTVARFGGDEFVIVCEGSDANEVQAIIDRLKAAFVAPFWSRGTPVSLSVDVGIASASSSEDDPGQLLQAADRAMYVVKQREAASGGVPRAPTEGQATTRQS